MYVCVESYPDAQDEGREHTAERQFIIITTPHAASRGTPSSSFDYVMTNAFYCRGWWKHHTLLPIRWPRAWQGQWGGGEEVCNEEESCKLWRTHKREDSLLLQLL